MPMSAKNKKAAARSAAASTPAPIITPPVAVAAATGEAEAPFYQRHPKIANALFVGLCIYVAMIWLLALDQTFHWGIFGPKLPITP